MFRVRLDGHVRRNDRARVKRDPHFGNQKGPLGVKWGQYPALRQRTRPPTEAACARSQSGVEQVRRSGLVLLTCLTVFVLGAAPPACIIWGVGETLSGDPAAGKITLLCESAVAAIVVIWLIVVVVFFVRRKGPLPKSKGAAGG